ncbi:hypothetical protein BSKO_01339 [Bryopsis sp. KO-2023]|nr:hypothetical protein BSKO_01339 [Bryopsis sp. KO-2023]
MTQAPLVLWAQRKDCLLLTVDVQDCKDTKVQVDKDDSDSFAVLRFSGKAGSDGKSYAMDMELLKEVDPAETKVSTTGRNVFVMIPKKEEGFWPKLVRQKAPHNVKVDWSKWVDSDDEGGDEGFDMSQMGQFSGLDGMDFSDSDDDEDVPGLAEEAKEKGDEGDKETSADKE